MTKIRFYWGCLPESAVKTSEDKYYLNYLATAHFNKNHLKYNLTFDYLIELLRVVFKISRSNAYSKMSNAFSIDALPRSTPTKSGLKKSADKIPSKFIDKLRVLNQRVSNSAVPDIYHLIITNSDKSLPNIEIQSSPPNEREFYSSESLTFDKRRIDNKNVESNDLELFYIDNISLITKLRSMSYLEEQKVTQELLARLLSPFWLAEDGHTTLDAQKRLLKKVLEEKKVLEVKKVLSKNQVRYQFHQEASLPRTARYNKVRLIKVIIDSETVKHALHIMHHIEGIFIVILADKIHVTEVSRDPDKGSSPNHKNEDCLYNWLQNLNNGKRFMKVKFHYRQAKNEGSYPHCRVEVIYNVNKDEGDYNYMLQQSSDVRGGKTHYTSTERQIFLANDSQPHMIDNPSYVVESEILFKTNEIIELNLVHLKINELHKVTSLLHQWANTLDTTPRHEYIPPVFEPLNISHRDAP